MAKPINTSHVLKDNETKSTRILIESWIFTFAIIMAISWFVLGFGNPGNGLTSFGIGIMAATSGLVAERASSKIWNKEI